MKNINKKYYKFALYGLSGSGKTCMLTAMAMVRRTTTDNSMCGMLAVDSVLLRSLEQGENIEQGFHNLRGFVSRDAYLTTAYDVSQEKRDGISFEDYKQKQDENFPPSTDRRWQGYIQDIKNGRLPDPTPHAMDKFPVYLYEGKNEYLDLFYFAILDYAGGRLSPNALSAANSMTEELTRSMEDSDGIIVLAPVVKKGQNADTGLREHLEDLAVSLGNLTAKTGTKKCPLALVLTKWDWQSDIPVNSPDAEIENMKSFIEQNDLYKNIANKINNKYFKIFPVSALGKCNDDGNPKVIEPVLQSYGVPFPFCWLAEQINEMELERLKEVQNELPSKWLPVVLPLKWEGLSTSLENLPSWLSSVLSLKWCPVMPLLKRLPVAWQENWQAVDEAGTLAKKLLNRLPDNATNKINQVKQIRQKVLVNIISRCLLFFVLLCGLWYYMIGSSNGRMLRNAEIAIQGTTDGPILQRYQSKLESYIKGSYFPLTPPHFAKARAENLLTRILDKYEEILYNTFNNAPLEPVEAKEGKADNYLAKYPQGKYSDAVQDWMLKYREVVVIIGNQGAIDDLVRLWDIKKSSTNISDIQEVINKGNVDNFFKYPKYATDEQKVKRNEIVTQANKRVAELNWEQYARGVRDEFDSGNINGAYRSLGNGSGYGDKWNALCKEIIDKTENEVDKIIDGNGTNYSKSINEIKGILSSVQISSNDGIGGADTLSQNLNKKIKVINQRWDKRIYDKVKSERTETSCDNYLTTAPLKTMTGTVNRYKEYLAEYKNVQKKYEEAEGEYQRLHGGEGQVPPLPSGAVLWEKPDWFSAGKKYVEGQWLPIGTEIRAETSLGWNIETTKIKKPDIRGQFTFPNEPSLPEWRP
ncbi:MAG: hypothetical protein LBQ50_08045 [Planctomycetaceae bacterium]|jgi:hypothetical protein|nr:hypothetical protein [Planctomycetaceae bacterium]